MHEAWWIGALLFVVGCSHETEGLCGDGLEPVVVTGLNGTIDAVPSVEVMARVPETCEVTARTWMFWDDASETVSFGDEPSEGTLERGEVTVEDDGVFFREVGVGVRLRYPGDVLGPSVDFVWTASGRELARARCESESEALRCAPAPEP